MTQAINALTPQSTINQAQVCDDETLQHLKAIGGLLSSLVVTAKHDGGPMFWDSFTYVVEDYLDIIDAMDERAGQIRAKHQEEVERFHCRSPRTRPRPRRR